MLLHYWSANRYYAIDSVVSSYKASCNMDIASANVEIMLCRYIVQPELEEK